ncbi:hypothetical protein DAPPUDRAFT_323463 [Daphnia pulex]|uniref:Uncharacterized protein n=1 Tax=Daphnia pulex TaxID=6669 RepID=E9GYX1_DAPPU|nr:hypothetical protein DAPPUDRAFT_323463 [Daphnia pulex]|eukprot:EFX75333.1 hypothetical protein DAPPUDRAFT_323463 [Daphnia pulex]
MAKSVETTKKKATTVLEKSKDEVTYNEILNVMKDDLSIYERQQLPNDLHYGTAMVETMISFMEADFYDLPAGLKCSNCYGSGSITQNRNGKKPTIPAEALQLLHDFIKTTDTMPNSVGYVKCVMPPIGSIGNGLASYRDMIGTLTDQKGTQYSPLSDVIYIVHSVIRNNFDKITIVASKMSSITCKPANLIE